MTTSKAEAYARGGDLGAFFPAGAVARAVRARAEWNELARAPGPTIIVIGSGIAGLVLASRLARGRGPRVVLVTGRPPVARRLVDGCSLRRSAIALMADAVGCEARALQDRLGGDAAAFYALRVRRGTGTTTLQWEGPVLEAGEDRPIGLSTRHGEILAALRERLPDGVQLVLGEALPAPPAAEPTRVLHLRLADGDLAVDVDGDHTLVLDTTPAAVVAAPPAARPPRHVVIAVQQPMRPRPGAASPFDGARVAFAPSFAGARGPQLGFVTPFWDPCSPAASWYGINTAVIDAATLSAIGERALIEDVAGGLARCAEAVGLEPVDAEATTGRACVPVVAQFDAGVGFALHRAFSPGAPAVNVDGMLAQAVGATCLARALEGAVAGSLRGAALRGLRDARRALRPLRRWNRVMVWQYFRAPDWVRRVSAATSRPAMPRLVRAWSALGLD